MIFDMRFQILALAASLTASTLAGYAVAVPPAAPLANPDRFAAIGDAGRWSATIFTEFGNEMAWEEKAWQDKAWQDKAWQDKAWQDKAPGQCASLRDNARSGGGLLEGLVHRVNQGGAEGRTAASGTTACTAP
jgi:hypothetical protein